ncbi:MAG TPA: exonuclease domain-containing protein, partial [Thermomicrobiales bacterium]|nr:exonuclease domain-containing protein [Thermomicrobiales bacterium]
LRGVLDFLGAPLADHARRLAALPARQVIVLRPDAGDADAAAGAVILAHALGHYLGRTARTLRPDEPCDPGAFTIELGTERAPSASGFGLGVRRTREYGYSVSTQAWRLGQMLLIAGETGRDQPFVAFDLETGDRHPSRAEVIEVAALRLGDDDRPASFHSFVRPSGPQAIATEATSVHGLAWRDVRDAPPAATVLPHLLAFLDDATLVGHNVEAFDYPVLRRIARECGLAPPVHVLIDTYKMARRLLPEEPSHRLEDLGRRFGLADQQRHRSLDDVELNARVFAGLVDIVNRERELDALSEALPLVALGIRASGVPLRDENATLARAGARALQFGQGIDPIAAWRALAAADAPALLDWLRNLPWASPADDDRWHRLVADWRAAVAAFERAATDTSLPAFLRHAALAASIDYVPTPDDPDDAADPRRIPVPGRVAMMTIHSAKGLEWPFVVILGAEDGQMPLRRTEDLDEERRVLFVGMTRARTRLFIAWSRRTLGYDRALSPFLANLPGHLLERHVQGSLSKRGVSGSGEEPPTPKAIRHNQ